MATVSWNLCVIVKFNVLPVNCDTQFKLELSLFLKNYSYIIIRKKIEYLFQAICITFSKKVTIVIKVEHSFATAC